MSDILQELRQEQEERRRIERDPLFEELRQNPEPYDILIAHGSNSGSLIGFAQEKGLVPAGWMYLEGKSSTVPFSGELSKGISREGGISKKAISFANEWGRQALKYATTTEETRSNVEGWTPEFGRSTIELYRSRLEDPYYANNDASRNMILKSIELEERRLATFDELSPQEQSFVTTPFPVVYGVHYKDYKDVSPCIEKMYDAMGKEITGEVFVEGRIDAFLLTLFVPRERIEETKGYLKARSGLNIIVLPLEIYSFLVNRDWANWNPSGDVYNQAKTLRKRFLTLHDYVVALKRWNDKSPT